MGGVGLLSGHGLLLNERTAAAVQDFAQLLTPERIAGLLPRLADRLVTIEVAKWGDPHAPGLVPLWRMIRDRVGSIDLTKLETDLDASLELVAPRNLALLQELVYWFTTSSRELPDIFEAKSRARLIAKGQSLLVQHYANNPNALIAQLRGAPAPLLLQVCYGLERIRQRRLGKPFDDWDSIALTLIDALPLDPETIAPQLSALVTTENPRIRGPNQWILDKAQCEALFGDPKAVADQLRNALAGKQIDDRSAIVIDLRTEIRDDELADDEDIDDQEHDDLSATSDEGSEVSVDGDGIPDGDEDGVDADDAGTEDGTATSSRSNSTE